MTLQIWDIGGQTLGGKMLDNYLAGANVRFFHHSTYFWDNYCEFMHNYMAISCIKGFQCLHTVEPISRFANTVE